MTEPRKELTFLEHLEELRWTLVRSAAAVVACTVLAFIYKDFVFDTLILAPQRPDFITYRLFCQLSIKFGLDRSFCADNTGFTLMNTTMGGQFLVHIMVSFTAGIIIAFPYVLWEVWRFVKPGLGGGEKLAVRGEDRARATPTWGPRRRGRWGASPTRRTRCGGDWGMRFRG